MYKFWEKPTNSSRTLDGRTAMGENQKITILTQEVIRRLHNTQEELDGEVFRGIVDRFAQKMINSGHKAEMARRITIAGIKGWRSRIQKCRREGRRIRRTARHSLEARIRMKLLGKATWFKKRRKGGEKPQYRGRGAGKRSQGQDTEVDGGSSTKSSPRSVIFVEQTPGGELACRLKELLNRIEPMLGFSIKVVERTGRSIQSLFPLTNLWDGAPCGREEECTTCYQGAEIIPKCTEQSVVYENVCAVCVKGARSKEELDLKDIDPEKPVVYVGETSRSIIE